MRRPGILWCIPFSICGALFGQMLSLQVVGVTHTQAILSYEAPDDNPCTIEVSEFPSLALLVHDVNGTLFPGANSDASRSLSGGRKRIVVIGKRRSDKATDGRLYSRALAAATPHYVRVTCGSVQGETRFVTRPLAWGDTSSEPPPWHAEGFGNYGWPTIDFTPGGRDKEYVDPMTGVKLKLAAHAGQGNSRRGEAVIGADYWWDWQGAWTNPENIRSGTTSALASTSTANAAIFVGIEPNPGVGIPWQGDGWGGYGLDTTIDDVGLRIYGSGTDANSANRQIQVCLSMDSGQTCHSPAITVTLPQGSASDLGLFPPAYPTPMFASWAMRPLRRGMDWPKGGGTVNVSGNTVTLTNPSTSTMFLSSWAPGSKIWISGSSPTCPRNLCTVVSVQSATQLTIQESLNLTGVNYRALNFGYRIWKTTSTGTVSLSIRKAIAWSNITLQSAGGSNQKCSMVPVTTTVDRDGNPIPKPLSGYLCVFSQNGALDSTPPIYWISEETGESRLVAIPWHDIATYVPGTAHGDRARPGWGGFNGKEARWDLNDGRVFYAIAETNTPGKLSVFKIRYTGDFREFRPNYPTNETRPVPPLEWENLSKPSEGRDIHAQIAAYGHPEWDGSKFGWPTVAFDGVSGAILMLLNPGGQGTPCWIFLFGFDGNLKRMFNTWSGAPWDGADVGSKELRWAGCHNVAGTIFPMDGNPGYISVNVPNGGSPATYNNTRLLGGPFTSPVIAVKRASGWDFTNTSVSPNIGDPSYDSTCPSDIPAVWHQHGATGNNCLTIRIGG
ncbi:MAG: hypothetical protein NZM33_13515, partial [Bryobacteraceae bacterium]|nr:hypothetical protein [Bryobacteraceae bacterium]